VKALFKHYMVGYITAASPSNQRSCVTVFTITSLITPRATDCYLTWVSCEAQLNQHWRCLVYNWHYAEATITTPLDKWLICNPLRPKTCDYVCPSIYANPFIGERIMNIFRNVRSGIMSIIIKEESLPPLPTGGARTTALGLRVRCATDLTPLNKAL